jgi:heme exporter protein D
MALWGPRASLFRMTLAACMISNHNLRPHSIFLLNPHPPCADDLVTGRLVLPLLHSCVGRLRYSHGCFAAMLAASQSIILLLRLVEGIRCICCRFRIHEFGHYTAYVWGFYVKCAFHLCISALVVLMHKRLSLRNPLSLSRWLHKMFRAVSLLATRYM